MPVYLPKLNRSTCPEQPTEEHRSVALEQTLLPVTPPEQANFQWRDVNLGRLWERQQGDSWSQGLVPLTGSFVCAHNVSTQMSGSCTFREVQMSGSCSFHDLGHLVPMNWLWGPIEDPPAK